MHKIALTLIAALSLSAPAHADTTKGSFEHEGSTYVYTVKDRGDVQLISGTAEDGAPFRLVVNKNSVRGTYNGNRVSFDRADVLPIAVAAR